MNTPKTADYSNLFIAVDQMLGRKLPQLTLYFQLGKLLDHQPETGAIAAVAKYLAEQHPDLRGFSPRSLRRMRTFYRTYKNQPCALLKAMRLGWTQNIVIFEADLTVAEREWDLNAAYQFGWSKLVLAQNISDNAYQNLALQEKLAAGILRTHIGSNTHFINSRWERFCLVINSISIPSSIIKTVAYPIRSPPETINCLQIRR